MGNIFFIFNLLHAFKHPFYHHRARYFPVCRFGYYERVGTFYHVVGYYESAPHGQTVHEFSVVCHRHVGRVYRPTHVFRQYLAVVFGACHARTTPVLCVYEVGTFECFHLIVFHACVADELRVKLIALGMCDNEVHIGRVHPLCKRVWYGLRQCAAVRCPRENDLGLFE